MTWPAYRNFTVARDDRGVVGVTLDEPSHSVNVIDEEVITELESIVSRLECDPLAKVVILRSGKESGFLAGGDVHAIAQLADDATVEATLLRGQNLFARIEALPARTVAAIRGVCLGGGLELALACDYRIAADEESTRLGFPEIQLGLIPGWGGTQRAPRQVGLLAALPIILRGKRLSASQAADLGLVDLAVAPEDWDRQVAIFVSQLLQPEPRQHRPKRSWHRWLADRNRLGRWWVLKHAAQQIQRDDGAAHYPALRAAVRAIRAGYSSAADGYQTERKEFTALLQTSTCRHLLNLFLRRERARDPQTWIAPSAIEQPDAPTIHKLAVIGAGVMGAGLGHLAAVKEFPVVLKEIDETAVEAGWERIGALCDDWVAKRRWSSDQREALLSRIEITTHWEALHDADLVVEAIVENEETKHRVFAELDQQVQPAALLTSNTSALSIARLAEATRRPMQVAGLHFFNPLHRMELVEIARTRQTNDATVLSLLRFVRALGKTPVVTADAPGFVVNRVLFPYLGEAVRMVCEGTAADQIDREIRRFGMPMGPLELLDQVGIDVASDVAQSLASVLAGPQPILERLTAMRDRGWLGKKSGVGFYRYDKGKAKTPSVWKHSPRTAVTPPPEGSLELHDDGLNGLQRRLLYPLINEAARCIDDGIVREPWVVDLAMVLGTGFAPFRGGPLQMLEEIGAGTFLHNLLAMEPIFATRLQPAAFLLPSGQEQRAPEDQTFPRPSPNAIARELSNEH